MGENDESAEQQTEQSPLDLSIKLELIASVFSTIGEALGILALLEAIEEEKIEDKQEQQEQKELDQKLERMQAQIDTLTNALDEIKNGNIY
ncbi:hypothetical protein JOC34_004030 [Virgibacillus halotolerans]|uniref:hypothetical protein n=1 Tax=Virgibacillus halotolerans TaxID=1071053 RepID=UPI00195F2724|nr:hypothetical protein [Virgibacillus halotolerans]MBM7601602.1 hypothetical protein [Virgibacillus halotolerans]